MLLHYQIQIISKNKVSIKNFVKVFNKLLQNFNNITKYLKKKRKIKILTILKSPHVNKTAQEQFETRLYFSQINIRYSTKNLHLLIFLKKLKNYVFPDIKIKIKFLISDSSIKKTQTQLLDPNNFDFQFFSKKLPTNNINFFRNQKSFYFKKNNFKQTQHLLKIFDIYGHLIK
jgi:ribosomal protein S10